MNILNKSFYLLLLAVIGLLSSCSDEDDPFAGKDNYIASFSLKQGDKEFNAVISDNVITVTAPEGISLNGAAATIKLSENATIYPDPKSVTEWDDEMQFAVTAYNGSQIRYKYTVVRSDIGIEGSVVLETQADVDAFGEKGITAIKGNLVIGRTIGTESDSISTLAPLLQLKEIGYSLIIHPTFSGKDLTGLDKLEKIGGEIRIDGARNLEKVNFPGLKTAGGMYIKNTLIGLADFPVLTSVSETLTLDCPLAGINFPKLKIVKGKLSLNTANGSNAMMSKISFPSLEETADLSFTYFKSTKKVDLPELKKVGAMTFSQLTMLSFINAPKLEVATGVITIPSTTYLTEVSFPAMTQATTLSIDSKYIKVLDFPKLKTVSDRLAITYAQIEGILDFKALERVEGELYLYDLPQMTALKLPAGIKYIGRLTIGTRTATPIKEINVKGLNIGELKVLGNSIQADKIIGDDVFKGTLTIASSGASYNNGYPGFPALEGFHEVDSLSLDGYVSYMDTVHIRGIRKINKGFRLENNNIKRYSMPDIEEVGGDFYFARLDQGVDKTLEFPKLKRVGGYFDLNVGSVQTRILRFPSLESVGGDFRLGTGYNADRSLEDVQFPVLKSIGGAMILNGYSSSYKNQLLKNLDGFASLEKAQSIEITNQMAIESYNGLKKVFSSLTNSGWKTSGNNYNPTYEDLQAGKWVKP
ncbi:hypothetical protein IR083_11695 [Dysgonomonas sp. GY75]|uniref:hypothetical protein n=1 Tax=Dysgonomonas sp. GY75 TaxID=2780419 RepID=UPI0018835464|nr:hypothetical protein [Dysgonomonas sp. GY75]MBF0649483.1 hypothetical protein [Dysgonomonas sp. GY75]